MVYATFNGAIMLLTNFISHTVGAITTLQVVARYMFITLFQGFFVWLLACTLTLYIPVGKSSCSAGM